MLTLFESQPSDLKSILWVKDDVVGYKEAQVLLIVVVVDLLDTCTMVDDLTGPSTRFNICKHTSSILTFRSWLEAQSLDLKSIFKAMSDVVR